MNREEAKRQAIEQFESVLERDIGKPIIKDGKSITFQCPICGGGEKTPCASYNHKNDHLHCFSCGWDGDIFDYMAEKNCLSKGSKEVFDKTYEILGIAIDENKQEHDHQREAEAYKELKKEVNQFCSKAKENISSAAAYLSGRDISLDTAQKIGLGYANGNLIIPYNETTYIKRPVVDTSRGKAFVNKGGSRSYYIPVELNQELPVFVTEGEMDAIAIVEGGFQAIAFPAAQQTRGFIDYAIKCKDEFKQPYILMTDNDKIGIEAKETIVKALSEKRIKFIDDFGALNKTGCKDANDLLLKDRKQFIATLAYLNKKALQYDEIEKEKRLQAYREKNSVLSFIPDFLNGIKNNVDTPFIKTGFKNLDAVLDGGLYEGVYTIGAVSGAGKTTFCMQVADQIAQQGHDVLVFALEMSRSQLMARSISRNTVEYCIEYNLPGSMAKTERGITVGKRYAGYSTKEHEVITESIKRYAAYSDHLYINEGIGIIGTAEIREAVKEHVELTGNAPVVIIDYVQILKSSDPRMSDKQKVDECIFELKKMTRAYKNPVIVISSFNRTNYFGDVTMTAFKESGAIEYSSDVLLGIQFRNTGKDGFNFKDEMNKTPREVEISILKNRSASPYIKVPFDYYPMFNKFEEVGNETE